MRHGKKFNHLGRKAGHRKALLKNMAASLIEHKRIKTTLAKAKALRRFIEPLVTKAKSDSVHNRRVVFSYLQNKQAVAELFGDIAAKVGDRPGGYVRIIKLGFRRSDGAEMAIVELVDYNETYSAPRGGDDSGKKRRRSRRGGSNKAQAAAEEVAEETVEEVEEATETEEGESEAPSEEAEK